MASAAGTHRVAIVGFDGSPAAERAIREAAPVLTGFSVVVAAVWEPDVPFELVEAPMIPPAPIDLRTAFQLEESVYEAAQRAAERGAALAREAGLDAEALAVADDVTVATTLVRLGRERHADTIVIGTHGHRGLRDHVVGSTARDVIKDWGGPVIVVASKKS
jgi:nucleotide-binding universal stress UspA family protein